MNRYLVIALSTVVVTTCYESASGQVNSGGTITLGGDQRPERTSSQYSASCGRDSLVVRISSDKQSSSSLVDVVLNNQSLINTPQYQGLRQFMTNLNFPYVTEITCSSGKISIVVAGRPRVGDDTTFRITFSPGTRL